MRDWGMKFLPLDEEGSPLANGNVTVEHREYDWKAYVTGDPARWEASSISPERAIEKLRVSFPHIFN